MSAITVWRITSRAYADRAFTGEGAEKYGSRFNTVGNRVVYASGSLSLAILEILVRVNDRRRMADHVCIPVTFDEVFVEALEPKDLSPGWDSLPYTRVSQRIGDAWIESASSAVLRVPSVVVPIEYNYLLNPAHPDFGKIQIGEAMDIPIDKRLTAKK